MSLIAVYESAFNGKEDLSKNFFRRFKDCALATMNYISTDPYYYAVYVMGGLGGFSGYILAGLAIGCSAFIIFG